MAALVSYLRRHTNPAVFFTSAGLIAAFVLFSTLFTERAQSTFTAAQEGIAASMGWSYHLLTVLFLVLAVAIAASRYGRVRLGGQDERPRYGYLTWFSMLFSAGLGSGVLLWSVAEPVMHYENPPIGEGASAESAVLALDITLLHWGLHGWGIYVVVGVCLAYASFRRGLPLTLRSAFQPLLGKRVDGPIGDAIDIAAIVGTLFGVATTLGLGAKQIGAGIAHVLELENSLGLQLLLIVVITALATVSVVSGIDRGIRRLSEVTIAASVALLLVVVLAGPTMDTLASTAAACVNYASILGTSLLWPDWGGAEDWQANWTLFYWGWWFAWAPFVGLFIARISRGRTIREFVAGVLLVPTCATTVWFSVFGGASLDRIREGDEVLVSAVTTDFAVGIYVFLSAYPFATALSVAAVLVAIAFFVTSSDSASLIVDYLASGGNLAPPTGLRIFWSWVEGVVAAVLLIAGGLSSMRAFQIVTGLPISLMVLAMCWAFVRSLVRHERR